MGGIGHHRALRQLEAQQARGEGACLQEAGDVLDELDVLEVAGREVDRDRQVPPLVLPGVALLDRLPEHPAGEGLDEPTLLGQGDEPVRRNDPALGVPPADEGLRSHHRARLQVDLGLVVQEQLVALDGPPQLAQQHERAGIVGISLRGVDHEAASAAAGRLQGRVRAPQEQLGGLPMVGADADADAHRHLDGQLLHHEGGLQGLEDGGGHLLGEARVRPGEDGGELVTAQPGHPVRLPEHVPHPAGQLADDAVRVGVPQGVPDLAVAVEGHEQQGHRPPLLTRRVQGPGELLQEEGAIGKAGEGVVMSQLPDGRGRPLLLRDVHHEAPHEARVPLGVAEGLPFGAPPQDVALAVQQAVLALEGLLGRAGITILLEHPVAVLGVDLVGPGARVGQPLRGRVAGHGLELRADVDGARVLVRPGDVGEGGDLLDEAAVEVLGLLPPPLGFPAGLALAGFPQLALHGGPEPPEAALGSPGRPRA